MTNREADVGEIVEIAKSMLEPPPTYGNVMSLAPFADPLGAAKEMFLNVFVSNALDQLKTQLDSHKGAIAAAAAEYATKYATLMMDGADEGLVRLKAALGLPASPPRP